MAVTETSTKPVGGRELEPSGGPVVPAGVIDELMARVRTDGLELLGDGGIIAELTKKILERALDEELTDHLGYERGDPTGRNLGNSRNGTTPKRVLTEIGAVDLDVPRDRDSSFEPKLVPKGTTRLTRFNENIIALYAAGMSTRDITKTLKRMYSVEVSPDLISRVTDGVLAELAEWQARPLDAVYPIVYVDALVVKVRTSGVVSNRPAYVAVGVDVEGRKHVLGVWLGVGGEGFGTVKYWAHVLTEIKNRGTQDVCIVVCDGLKGLPEAVTVDVARGDRADMRRASNSREFPLRLEAGLAGVGQGPQADLHRGDGSGGARAFGRDGGAVGGEVSGHHRPVGERVGGVRAVPQLRQRDPHRDLHHERY